MILPRSGQDGLILADASAFGAAAGRIAFDQIQFAHIDLRLVQSRSLPGSPPPLRAPLRSRTSCRALRALSRASAASRPFWTMIFAVFGFSSRNLAKIIADGRVDDAFDFAVAELGLRLALELRLGHAERDDGRQALAAVVAAGDRGPCRGSPSCRRR